LFQSRAQSKRPEERKKFPWLKKAQDAWDLLDAGEVKDVEKVSESVAHLIHVIVKHQAEMNEIDQRARGKPNPEFRPFGLQIFREDQGGEAQLLQYLKGYKAAVIFNGHGSKQQFYDMTQVERVLDIVVKDLNERIGPDWLVIYGGEPYIPDCVTIVHAVRLLHMKYNRKVLMIQCDYFGDGEGGSLERPSTAEQFAFMQGGAAFLYKTEYGLSPSGFSTILYGGYHVENGLPVLCGASKWWYSDAVLGLGVIKAHVFLGGGHISTEEATHSESISLPLMYVPCEVKYKPMNTSMPSVVDMYGLIEHWANDNDLPRNTWFPHPPELQTDRESPTV